MGGNNSTPQAPSNIGNPNLTISQPDSSMTTAMPTQLSAMAMPNQQQMSDPYNGASPQARQSIMDMQAMRASGVFNTPYQNAMQKHPILMGLANGMQAFGQGITHQPIFTGPQENQASLQNTQASGMNNMVAMPAQMRMQMMLYHPELFGGQAAGGGQSNIPGVTSQDNTIPSLSAPDLKQVSLPPQLAKAGASTVIGGVPYVRDGNGNWTPQGGK